MSKVTFELGHGQVEGIYLKASEPSAPLVVITNGHNGFYNYGMFPHIQKTFQKHGISSYSYNFSHGGVVADSDYFTELDKYEKNSMRLETLDLLGVLEHLSDSVLILTRALISTCLAIVLVWFPPSSRPANSRAEI